MPGTRSVKKASKGLFLLGLSLVTSEAFALGDSGTRFNAYVPPNNQSDSRASLFVVTNVSPDPATVDIIDDDLDGDSDDTSMGVTLQPGQSHLTWLKDGAVNDDRGGKRDGDYLKVRADRPVVVQMASSSNWQHDWVPSETKGGRGRSFFIYAPPTSGADNDLNVYAYEDSTVVTVTDITIASTQSTGVTVVDRNGGLSVLEQVLNSGEDLNVRRGGLGLDILDPGHTYWVQATRPVTVQSGHLGQVTGGNQARDGAGFVPSANGSSTGSLYYFSIPHNPGLESEKELRISCFDDATVTLHGATATTTEWEPIYEASVLAGGHLDLVGAEEERFRANDLYRLTVDPPHHRCTVFEGNWMETGSYGTSDFASAVSASNGTNLGRIFSAYLGPPGLQNNVAFPTGELTNLPSPADGYASHLYVYGTAPSTQVTVTDVDTGGDRFTHVFDVARDGYFDLVVSSSDYAALTADGGRPYLKVAASEPVMVMNGNFNDNWMAFFHSVSIPEPRAALSASRQALSCDETTELEASCANGGDVELQNAAMRVTFPPGVVLQEVPAGAVWSPSAAGGKLSLPLGSLGAGITKAETLLLQRVCEMGACSKGLLAAVTVECSGTGSGEPLGDLATLNLSLPQASAVQVASFVARDFPDYEAVPPQPRTLLSYEISAPVSATVRLERVVDDPDPDTQATVLKTHDVQSNTENQTITFEDPYVQHYEETRYYRLIVEDGQCSQVLGPRSVRTSSGMSSGFDGGLESDGTLAAPLARRAVLRARQPFAIEPRTLQQLPGGPVSARAESTIAPMHLTIPSAGPKGSAPVNVTPGDLPALTNAVAVTSADYVDAQGLEVASLLVIETTGEVYDHSKALCDRAGGSHVDLVDRMLLPEGALLRFATRNDKQAKGEYVTEFKAFEKLDGSYEVHAAWLQEHYPEPEPDQTVLNFQFWSATPGLELTLAEMALDLLDAPAPVAVELPPAYFEHAKTLGGLTTASLSGDWEGLTLRETRLLETGELRAEITPVASGQIAATGRSLDVTLELLNEAGRVLDRAWVSDGAWAVLDDSMLGGTTVVTEFSDRCDQVGEGSAVGVSLAGCARVQAEVSDFAGVGRHLNAGAELNLFDYEAVNFVASSNRPFQVCLESSEGEAACVALPEARAAKRFSVPMGLFRTSSCGEPEEDIRVVTFLAHGAGDLEMSVQDLELANWDPGLRTSLPTGSCRTDNGSEAVSSGGCSVTSGQRPSRPVWLLLVGLFVLRRVRGRRCS